jgi:NADH-quinone oxidoreductase subunit E
MTLQAQTRTVIEQARDRYPRPRSAILPALWAVQHELGEITPEAMGEVAGILKVAPSEVEAVSTFYSMYFQHPHGRHEVIVCINVSCALRGAEEIVDHLETSLGCASGETTADGEFTWSSTVECLGGCGGAPTMQLDHHFQENLTPERVDAILNAVRQGAPAGASGPQVVAAPAPKSAPRRAAKPAPKAVAEKTPDATADAALPLTTPKEPDPASTTAPQPKGRGRRPSKGAQ